MKLHAILKYVLVLLLLAGMGCEKTILDSTITFGKDTSFRINQLYTSTNGQYTLIITEIADSRCPIGAECFWSGEVNLKGEWTVNNNKSTFDIQSVGKLLDIQPAGYFIQIIDVKPYPDLAVDAKSAEKVVTLLIQRTTL